MLLIIFTGYILSLSTDGLSLMTLLFFFTDFVSSVEKHYLKCDFWQVVILNMHVVHFVKILYGGHCQHHLTNAVTNLWLEYWFKYIVLKLYLLYTSA